MPCCRTSDSFFEGRFPASAPPAYQGQNTFTICLTFFVIVVISSHLLILPFLPGLRIKETKEVYEGEVTELTPTESENPLSGYGKTVSHVVVGLKTVKGTKQLRLDPSIYEAILKEKIVVGDVIYVEANTGAVKVGLARSFHFV